MILQTGIKQLILAICTVGAVSCSNTEQKMETAEEARERVIQATRTLQESYLDSLNEYILYKAEIVAQLQENELEVSSFKTIIKLETLAIQDKFEKQIEQMEFKNRQLKTIITDHQVETHEKWILFKSDFNEQMNSLTQLMKEMNEEFIFNTSTAPKRKL